MPTAQRAGTDSEPACADEALRFALDAARIAAEGRVEDVAVLDLRGISSIADYFVIGTGTSERQMHAVLDSIHEHARSVGRSRYGAADKRSAHWILADYVDVLIHLFDAEHRDYYDLEGLWGDAPRIELEAPAPSATHPAEDPS